MQIESSTFRLWLRKDQIVKLSKTCKARITVRSGCVWVTEDRDSIDIVLASGQSYVSHGRVFIQGLAEAEVELED